MGVSKSESIISMGVLENAVRNDLNEHAPRVMAVLDPLKVVLKNYPEGENEWLEAARQENRPRLGRLAATTARPRMPIWTDRRTSPWMRRETCTS